VPGPDASRVAALRFFDILKLMSEDETLTPEVMVQVIGLTGALLAYYSDVTREDLIEVIDSTARDPVALEGLYLAVRALGLRIEGARDPEPDPEDDPEPPQAA
jgi:hypothetical protein